MPKLVGPLQTALSDSVPGAYLDVRQLQTNPVQYPIEIHVFGQADAEPAQEEADIDTLRSIAGQIEEVLRSTPGARRVRTDWMEQSPIVQLPINSDRANLAGVTNADIARSAAGGLSGWQVGTLLDGDSHIPIVARLRQEERAQLADVANLYVYSSIGTGRVPLNSLAPMTFQMSQERIVRRDHFRTMTVTAFPAPGVLPSEVMKLGHTENRSASRRASSELSHRDWRRTVQAGRRLRRIGRRAGSIGGDDLHRAGLAVQQSHQTVAGIHRRTVWRRRRGRRAMADAGRHSTSWRSWALQAWSA